MRGFFNVRKMRLHETQCFMDFYKNMEILKNGLKFYKNIDFCFLKVLLSAFV